MTKKEKSIVMELIAFADESIDYRCAFCSSRGCPGTDKCWRTKKGYEIVEKARNLLERKPNSDKR